MQPCGDVHSFRKPRGDVEEDVPEPIAAKKRAMMKKPTFDEFFAKHSDKNAKPYEFREHYHENIIVTHPKFGKGFVSEILSDSKVEVTFKDARRVLVHNRKNMPGLPLAAEGDGVQHQQPPQDSRRSRRPKKAEKAEAAGAAKKPVRGARAAAARPRRRPQAHGEAGALGPGGVGEAGATGRQARDQGRQARQEVAAAPLPPLGRPLALARSLRRAEGSASAQRAGRRRRRWRACRRRWRSRATSR